jgi:hypothetical protein
MVGEGYFDELETELFSGAEADIGTVRSEFAEVGSMGIVNLDVTGEMTGVVAEFESVGTATKPCMSVFGQFGSFEEMEMDDLETVTLNVAGDINVGGLEFAFDSGTITNLSAVEIDISDATVKSLVIPNATQNIAIKAVTNASETGEKTIESVANLEFKQLSDMQKVGFIINTFGPSIGAIVNGSLTIGGVIDNSDEVEKALLDIRSADLTKSSERVIETRIIRLFWTTF